MLGTAAELDRADRLLMTAYSGPSRRRELSRYLAVQPDGWFVIADGDHVTAIAGAIAYGSFCWLGLVATDPARSRQGLATTLSAHLAQWARERGCATVALDASMRAGPCTSGLASARWAIPWNSPFQVPGRAGDRPELARPHRTWASWPA
jgi:GNAT superfamily N-acetyltransferase